MRNISIILRYSTNAFQQVFTHPAILAMFIFSKTVRYGMFTFFISSLFTGITSVAGYSRYQLVFFYLIFTLIDTASQLLFREVYRFRPLVVSGGFDMVLTKPFSPLLRVLLGGPDPIDLGMLVLIVAATVYVATNFIHPTLFQTAIFLVMLFNSFILAAAFHIFVLGFGMITLSVDHLVMIYRDLTALMRIPVDLFTDPLRSILTFVIPIGIMFTFPAKAILGLLSVSTIIISSLVGVVALFSAVTFWNYSLRHYQSAGG